MLTDHSQRFHQQSKQALHDPVLQGALDKARNKFIGARRTAREALPEFDTLRDEAVQLKNHVLANLDVYLEMFADKVETSGGRVHFAASAEEAQRCVLDLCASKPGAKITKGKSMVSEEIGLNKALEAAGHQVIETDLGEYIIQLREEAPSHIIAPAVHLTQKQIETTFRQSHHHLAPERSLDAPEALMSEARSLLRSHFLSADIGITGANFLIADTGAMVLVTNEGNGDLTQTFANHHIVVTSIDKVLPTMDDAALMLRLLARSGTGQSLSVYTTLTCGPRRMEDGEGPERFDVVLIDNGRSNLLGTAFEEMLRCIKCGACLNHCPVYQAVGGHAYNAVYAGPIGSVVTPAITSIESSHVLPHASSFCGRCEAVCPMRIPLPKLLRLWREKSVQRGLQSRTSRLFINVWAFAVARPRLYGLLTGAMVFVLYLFGKKRGAFSFLPFLSAWTKHRTFTAPERNTTFQAAWAAHKAKRLT